MEPTDFNLEWADKVAEVLTDLFGKDPEAFEMLIRPNLDQKLGTGRWIATADGTAYTANALGVVQAVLDRLHPGGGIRVHLEDDGRFSGHFSAVPKDVGIGQHIDGELGVAATRFRVGLEPDKPVRARVDRTLDEEFQAPIQDDRQQYHFIPHPNMGKDVELIDRIHIAVMNGAMQLRAVRKDADPCKSDDMLLSILVGGREFKNSVVIPWPENSDSEYVSYRMLHKAFALYEATLRDAPRGLLRPPNPELLEQDGFSSKLSVAMGEFALGFLDGFLRLFPEFPIDSDGLPNAVRDSRDMAAWEFLQKAKDHGWLISLGGANSEVHAEKSDDPAGSSAGGYRSRTSREVLRPGRRTRFNQRCFDLFFRM